MKGFRHFKVVMHVSVRCDSDEEGRKIIDTGIKETARVPERNWMVAPDTVHFHNVDITPYEKPLIKP